MNKFALLSVCFAASAWAADPYFSGALKTLASASTQHEYVEVIGDSLSSCYQSNSVTSNLGGSCQGSGTTTQASLWTYSLGLRLKEVYGDGGSGLVPISSQVYGATGQQTAQWALSGPWQLVSTVGPSQLFGSVNVGTLYDFQSGSQAIVSGLQGQTLRVYYATGVGSSQGFHIWVDGSDRGLFGTDAYSGTAVAKVASVNVGAGFHSLGVIPVGAHAYVWAAGAENPTGVSIYNHSFGTCRTDCYALSPATQMAFANLLPASQVPLALVMLEKNEEAGGESPTTFQAHLSTLVSGLRASNSSMAIAIVDEPYSSTAGTYPHSAYLAANASVASQYNAFHIALNTPQFASYAAQSAAGYMQDGVHLTVAGQDAASDIISATVMDESEITLPIGKPVRFINRGSGKCMDVYGGPGATQPMAPLNQWDCLSGTNQELRMDPVPNGYEITVESSGLQLDVSGVSTQNGAAIVQYPYWGGANEVWNFVPTGDGFFIVTSLNTGKVLDVAGQSTQNHATVWQWERWGGDNQQWALIH